MVIRVSKNEASFSLGASKELELSYRNMGI